MRRRASPPIRDYGRIVCHCERVTRGEILAAARATVPARSLDGLRRRTRALLGRCQGFYCSAEVTRLLAEASGTTIAALLGAESGAACFRGRSRRAARRVMTRCDVLVVGGGPAGLAAAIELRRLGVQRVLVVEREEQAGGVPRHSAHTGFGLRDLRRLLDRSALRGALRAARRRRRRRAAHRDDGHRLERSRRRCPSPAPTGSMRSRRAPCVLATGCRERPRAARLVPGTRPLGVFTTGALQQLVYLQRQPRRAARGGGRRRARQLLRRAHARACRRADGRR